MAGVGLSVSPERRLGASWSRGAYLEEPVSGSLPPGRGLEDFDQEIWWFEAVYSRGPLVLRGEAFHDAWEVPNVADEAVDLSWYLEGQTDLSAGLWIAARDDLGSIQIWWSY